MLRWFFYDMACMIRDGTLKEGDSMRTAFGLLIDVTPSKRTRLQRMLDTFDQKKGKTS